MFKKVFIIFLLLFTLLPLELKSQQSIINPNQRYIIYKSSDSSLIILLDLYTGTTWRNIRCGDAQVPNCWQRMDYLDGSPLSIEVILDKIKEQDKGKTLQELLNVNNNKKNSPTLAPIK